MIHLSINVVVLLVLESFCDARGEAVSVFSMDEQLRRLVIEHRLCQEKNAKEPYNLTGLFCNRTWDNILCWPDTPAGHVARQPCPEYINKFDQGEFVTRHCTENGTWWVNPLTQQPWSNYTACEKSPGNMIPDLIREHMPGIKLMYTIGYSMSLATLVLALTIMIYFKRLHCPRNIIHMNMFLAFGVRAAFSLMKTVLLVSDLGFSNDVNQTQSQIQFVKSGTHWECKSFFTVFYYVIFASVMWLFNEGLYLQLILSISVFSDKTRVRWFVLLGWGTPLLFVIPWVFCRIYLDDMLCWNVHVYRGLYWIIHGPMMASVAINFVIFINTVRLLFTKLKATTGPDSKMLRYRKLFKSTLILIPLFAAYYMIFMLLPDDVSAGIDLFKSYVEMLFNSFQGFLVAMLFCFLNHEVQNEIRTKWRRRSLRSSGSKSIVSLQNSLFHRNGTNRENQDPQTDRLDKKHTCNGERTQPLDSVAEEHNVDANISKNVRASDSYAPQNIHLNSAHSDEVLQPLMIEISPQTSDTNLHRQSLVVCSKAYKCSEKHSTSSDSTKESKQLICTQNNASSGSKASAVLPINDMDLISSMNTGNHVLRENSPEAQLHSTNSTKQGLHQHGYGVSE